MCYLKTELQSPKSNLSVISSLYSLPDVHLRYENVSLPRDLRVYSGEVNETK